MNSNAPAESQDSSHRVIIEKELSHAIVGCFFEQIGFHRIGMLVERRVIIELKSTERLAESARRQLRSYVTALGLPLGILLHFGPMPRFHRELGGRRLAPVAVNSR
jgi:GxxExxY protein